MHPFKENINPWLGQTLSLLKIDRIFVKGHGSWLVGEDGRHYLDFVSGYGALPFGHNPKEIWAALEMAKEEEQPGFVQPSFLHSASLLAQKLSKFSGLQYSTFTNSGAEAIEAAIKLARSATGRRGIISTSKGFHGKTMGALSATGKEAFQKPFFTPVEGFYFVPYGDVDALEEFFKKKENEIAAVILEPVQGEGGVIVPPHGYLQGVRDVCSKHNVLLIMDEIQTGLGRTGYLFASESEGVKPDIMTLAKALGGGIFPVGVCLADEDIYTEEFGMKHSSTFAGSSAAAMVGLQVLEMLTKDNGVLLQEVRRKGNRFKEGLKVIASEFPHVISEVRGRGLMLGLDFAVTRHKLPETLLGIIGDQEQLTAVLSGHILNEERLRLAPTLTGSTTLRIQPPLNVKDEEIDYALEALERTARRLAAGNTAAVLSFFLQDKRIIRMDGQLNTPAPRKALKPGKDEGRWAFILHPLDMKSYRDFDRSMNILTDEEIEEITGNWSDVIDPFIVSETRITSPTGDTAFGEFIVVPRTSEELMSSEKDKGLQEIYRAVEMALERGARLVGLGAYTAVISKGGLRLKKIGVPLTTGNSYTVASAMEAVLYASRKLGFCLEKATAAVVGAGGAIGRAISFLAAEKVNRLYLIGNPAHPERTYNRLLGQAARIYQYLSQKIARGTIYPEGTIGNGLAGKQDLPGPEEPLTVFQEFAQNSRGPISISSSCSKHLPSADVAIVATSSIGEFITPEDLKFGAILCDISRPPNVSRRVYEERPDVLVIDGGVIEVAGNPDWGWNFGFKRGLAYGCMSETFLLALEKDYRDISLGTDLNLETINYLQKLEKKHGFRLAGLRSFDRPLDEDRWSELLAIHQHIESGQ